jgi:ribosomal protein S18 acetylase RimI-like enzyme
MDTNFENFVKLLNENSDEDFFDALNALNTLDLEDDQVRYPKFNEDDFGTLFGDKEFDVYIINREELPTSGSFECVIFNNDEEVIGFFRANTKNKIVSIKLIHIKDDFRNLGIGTQIYEYFLENDYTIKSDTEITYSTVMMYERLYKSGYKPIVFDDGRVGLKK